MASYREEEDPFEEDIVFDQAGLLTNTTKMNTAIRRVSSGKCALFAKTLGLCGAFFGLGLCIAIPGPTFLRPITELQADISPISSIYTARSSGYLIGSIIGGILFDHFNRLFLLFISLLLTAVFITVTPWCRVLWLLEACMVLLGMTMGFLDTGGNVLCLDLWGRNSGPFMQALHFSFGLGAFVAPLLAAPFLAPSSMDVSPTFMTSTATPFQVHNTHSLGLEREKRSILLENMTTLMTTVETPSNSWLESNTKPTENLSMPSNQVYAVFPLNTTSNPMSVSFDATDGLDTNRTTQTIAATERAPKRQPVKTNESSLDIKNWDKVHVGTVSQEAYAVFPVNTTSNPLSVDFDATDSLDTNRTTQTIATTQRVPKRKPVKTNASSLDKKDWDKVHVGTVSQEDLQQLITTTTPATTSPFTAPSSKANSNTTVKEDIRNISISVTTIPITTPVSILIAESFTYQNQTNNNTGVAAKENKDIVSTSAETMLPTTAISSKTDAGFFRDKLQGPTTDVITTSEPFSKSQIVKQPFLLRANESSIVGKDVNPHFDPVPTSESKDDILLETTTTNSGNKLNSDILLETTTANSGNKLNSDTNRTAKSSMQSVDKNVQYGSQARTVPSETQSYTNSKVLEELPQSVAKELDKSSMKSGTSSSQSESVQPVTEQKRLNFTREHSISTSTESTWLVGQDGTSSVSVSPLPGRTHHSKPVTYDNDTEVIVSIFDVMANRIEKYGFSKVQFTYFMVGLFVFAISLVFLGFLCHNPRDPKSKQEEGQGAKKISNRALHALLISLMALFFLLYVGLEVTYGQLVLAFAMHGDLQLAQSTGLVIAVVFWGSFAAMRFASIFFSSGFGPITMLILNFVFCTLGTVLLSTMASHTETALWVGTAFLGIGLASVFPTGILWIERYIHISNKVAAAFVVSASLGEMVCPIAVYRLMINNPAMLMHSAVVINVLCILTFIAIRSLALRHGEKYGAASNNGYQLANQEEEEDMIDMSPSGSMVTSRRHSFSSEHRALLNGNLHRGP